MEELFIDLGPGGGECLGYECVLSKSFHCVNSGGGGGVIAFDSCVGLYLEDVCGMG